MTGSFYAIGLGLFGLGFQLLCFRLWGIQFFPGELAVLFPVMMGGAALGAFALVFLKTHVPRIGLKQWAEFSGYSILLFSIACLVTQQAARPGNFSNFLPLSLGLVAMIFFGIGQAALLTQNKTPMQPLVGLGFGALVATAIIPLLDHFSLLLVIRLFLGAFILLVFSKHLLKIVGVLTIWFFPFQESNIFPEYQTASLLSNSYSQIKLAKLEPGVGRGQFLRPVREQMVRPGFENIKVYTAIRNFRDGILIFDAPKLEDLAVLKKQDPFPLMEIAPKNRAAVIGAGGGRELVMAQLAGFKKVDAIEINPLMVRAANQATKNPLLNYRGVNVTTHIEEARVFFRNLPTEDQFDAIISSNTKGFGAAGRVSAADNYIHTKEAIVEFIRHLAPGGFLILHYTAIPRDSSIAIRQTVANALHFSQGYELSAVLLHQGRRKDQISMGRGGFAILVKNGKLNAQEFSYLEELTQSGIYSSYRNFPSNGELEGNRLITDDRPRHFSNTFHIWEYRLKKSLALKLVILIGCLGVALSFTKAFAFRFSGLYALLSGALFAALETVVIERTLFLSGMPSASVFGVIFSVAAAGFLSSLWVLRYPEGYWPRALIIATAFQALLFVVFRALSKSQLDGVSTIAVILIILFANSFFCGMAYYRFFTYLQRNQPRAIGSALGFNAIGLIMGGIGIKILIFYLGFA
ncbi:MAG: methyltransferase domain-containing protein, partial [Bdellovibrionales bacterium]